MVRTQAFTAMAQVQSLVGELRLHKSGGTVIAPTKKSHSVSLCHIQYINIPGEYFWQPTPKTFETWIKYFV